MLIIVSLASINNLIFKEGKNFLFNFLWIPFLIYYFSIIISFVIDLCYNKFELGFLLRNLSVLIIPLFIFTSNFSKKQILNIFKNTSIIITFIGMLFFVLWVVGYYKNNNQQEFQKQEWFKNEITTSKDYLTKNAKYPVLIKPSSIKPSLRKVIMLTGKDSKSSIVREFSVKSNDTEKDVWVLLRSAIGGNCKAWFNVTNGKIGKVEGEGKVKSERLPEGFYKFTLANEPEINSNREWFYISFVANNGSYRWNNNVKQDVTLQLKTPYLYLDSGKNLLSKKSLFKYKITDFSNLENYAHSTYFGLIFVFALIFFIFNQFFNNWIRFFLIILNIFFLITLASKAVTISLVVIIPVYCLYNYFNYRYLVVVVILGVFLASNGHIKERFSDMFDTISSLNQNESLGDLETLSTNNRITIYQNYLYLLKQNFLVGHGYKNGLEIVNSKYNNNFNAHNQYLQSSFNSGIIGFFLLVLFSFSPFIFRRIKTKEKSGLELLILLILFNFLFESLLFRQWGLIFVCFCYSIYFQFFKDELKWFR
jgi:hypothetical protein